MTVRITRIIAIVTRLLSKQVVTAKEMSEQFGVSERTIYRDIRTIEEAGIPIYSEPGKGFSIIQGYTLPPIAFSEAEVRALLTAEFFFNNNPDSSQKKDLETALQKMKSTLRTSQKGELEYLNKRIYRSPKQEILQSDFLSGIQQAIIKNKQLFITYSSISKEEITARTIDPLGLYLTDKAWVLIAYCHLRNAEREFRVDRIQSLEVSANPFTDHGFSFAEYFKKISESYNHS